MFGDGTKTYEKGGYGSQFSCIPARPLKSLMKNPAGMCVSKGCSSPMFSSHKHLGRDSNHLAWETLQALRFRTCDATWKLSSFHSVSFQLLFRTGHRSHKAGNEFRAPQDCDPPQA